MCDAAWGRQGGGGVGPTESCEDISSGCKSSSDTDDIFLSVEAQVQPLRKQKIVVRPVCVHRDSDFKKVTHDTINNSRIVRMKCRIVRRLPWSLQSISVKVNDKDKERGMI